MKRKTLLVLKICLNTCKRKDEVLMNKKDAMHVLANGKRIAHCDDPAGRFLELNEDCDVVDQGGNKVNINELLNHGWLEYFPPYKLGDIVRHVEDGTYYLVVRLMFTRGQRYDIFNGKITRDAVPGCMLAPVDIHKVIKVHSLIASGCGTDGR